MWIVIPSLWASGLIAMYVGLTFHEMDWLKCHSGGVLTEDDMMVPGDYPNVTVGWILTGWLPILAGLLLSKAVRPRGLATPIDR